MQRRSSRRRCILGTYAVCRIWALFGVPTAVSIPCAGARGRTPRVTCGCAAHAVAADRLSTTVSRVTTGRAVPGPGPASEIRRSLSADRAVGSWSRPFDPLHAGHSEYFRAAASLGAPVFATSPRIVFDDQRTTLVPKRSGR